MVDVGPLAQDKSHKKALVIQISQWQLDGIENSEAVAKLHVYEPIYESRGFKTLGGLVLPEGTSLEAIKALPVVILPKLLAVTVLCGSLDQFPFFARWTHPFFPSLSHGLDSDWLSSNNAGVDNAESELKDGKRILTAEQSQEIGKLLRQLGQSALDRLHDVDMACNLRLELEKSLCLLWGHSDSLDAMSSPALCKLARMKYSSNVLVPQILASFDLSCKRMLQHHATKFISMLPEALQPVLQAWTTSQMAGGSVLQRHEMALDIAMELLHRERLSQSHEGGGVLKYGWGDSTSKFGLEIFNARYRWLKKSMCVELARAWRFLCSHPAYDDDLTEHAQEERCRCSNLLVDNVHLHTLVPQRLGDRRTALPDKVSAYVHANLLESSNLQDLERSFAEHISWCTDMGVEAGMPSFYVKAIENTLPPWLRPARVTVVPNDTFEDGLELQRDEVDQPAKPLMPEAFHMSGVCHAVHNSTASLNLAFPSFDDFLSKLKRLYQFLGSSLRVQRFLEVVMRGSLQYDHAKALFSRKLTSIYTERWNVLAICLEESYPLVLFLRNHWDPVRFSDDPHKSPLACVANPSLLDGWLPKDVTEIVNDSYFVAFWRMQMNFHKSLLRFQSWAEGCSCHGPTISDIFGGREGETVHVRHDQVLRSEVTQIPGVKCKCPLMGCQAPFLATECLEQLKKSLQASSRQFLVDCQERLSQEQWATLVQEWDHGSVAVEEQLRLRLAFFSGLPWVMLGGCHPDVRVARKALKQARDLWLNLEEAAKPLQHTKVQELFVKDTGLRKELDKFIDGDGMTTLEDFPALEMFLAPLTFVQVAERMGEGAHKDLATSQPKNFSMTFLSLNLRLPELNEFLSRDPLGFAALVEAFDSARDLKRFTALFPCYCNHPDMATISKSKNARLYERFARAAFYRDSRMQFADCQDGLREHEFAAKDIEKQHAKLKGKKKNNTESDLLANLATDVMRELSWEEPGSVFSIDNDSKIFSPAPCNKRRYRQALCGLIFL